MKVITFSRVFPKKHPREGQPTYFVEKIYNGFREDGYILDKLFTPYLRSYEKLLGRGYLEAAHVRELKHHTIRAGNWWKLGEQFSPRVWSGKPYRSKQVQFAPPITIEKIWDITIEPDSYAEGLDVLINDEVLVDAVEVNRLALNDGLDMSDFFDWFNIHPKKKKQVFTGQIISWSDKINY